MTGKIKHIAFVLLGALALTSCRDLSLAPVFYTLSQEQPLSEDRGFPDETSVFKMVRMTVAPTDYYVAAANTLYRRDVDGAAYWQKLAPPPGLTNAVCNTLELFGGELYAGFFDRDSGDGLGLWHTADLVSWDEITDGDVDFGSATTQITMLKEAGGELFVAVATWTSATVPDEGHFEYSLYHSGSGAGNSYDLVTYSVGQEPDPAKRIIDVASDGAGTYWLIAYNSIYRADGGAGSAFSSSLLDTPTLGNKGIGYVHNFGGLLYNTGILYLSATDGYLYSSGDDGATWTQSDEFLYDSDSDQPIPFGQFVVIGGGDGGSVYVGTGGYVGAFGYYRIPSGDITESSGAITREPSYNIQDLYEGAVNYLFYDDNLGSPRFFLCMNRSGLWRGEDWNGTSGDWTWKQE